MPMTLGKSRRHALPQYHLPCFTTYLRRQTCSLRAAIPKAVRQSAPGGSKEGSRWCSEAWRARTTGSVRNDDHRIWERPGRAREGNGWAMAVAQDSRRPLASFHDAVKVERWYSGVRWFTLAALISPRANLSRSSGAEEQEVCLLWLGEKGSGQRAWNSWPLRSKKPTPSMKPVRLFPSTNG